MPEPAPNPLLPAAPKPGERPLGLMMVALVNAVMAGPTFVALMAGAAIPPELQAVWPPWFVTFAKVDAAILLGASVGLFLLRRWGFGLMVLGYFAGIIALVVARQSFVCQAAVQFPLLAIAGRNWKALR
jgi:hypothetical protein